MNFVKLTRIHPAGEREEIVNLDAVRVIEPEDESSSVLWFAETMHPRRYAESPAEIMRRAEEANNGA